MTHDIQAHFDRLKALRATPGDTIEIFSGREWARHHPVICPHCKATFFTWKPMVWKSDEIPWQPYREDPEPNLDRRSGAKLRGTCGDPQCHKAEEDHQFRRRLEHNPPAALLQKAGEAKPA